MGFDIAGVLWGLLSLFDPPASQRAELVTLIVTKGGLRLDGF